MFCYFCNRFSFQIICKQCQKTFLKSTPKQKRLFCGLELIYFYNFEEIEFLLKTKYYPFGSRVFDIVAKNSFNLFAKNFEFEQKLYAISVDDNLSKGYSHSAILAKSLKSKSIVPYYSKLLSQTKVQYAGKDLKFRKEHKRNFLYSGKTGIKAILVDDIVTTGLTLCEAKEVLQKNRVEVLFALSLAC